MTLLNWSLSEESIFLLTDTLMTIQDKTPMASATKVYSHPHMSLLVAGTGSHQLVRRFDDYVACRTLARHVRELAAEAKPVLMALWGEAIAEGFIGTSTVYLFGHDPESGKMVAFSFASGDNFAPADVEYSFFLKPPLIDMGPLEERIPNFCIDDLIFAAGLQQAEDRAMIARDQMAGLGGQLVGHWLQILPDGRTQTSSQVVGLLARDDEDRAAMAELMEGGPEAEIRAIYHRRAVTIAGQDGAEMWSTMWPGN